MDENCVARLQQQMVDASRDGKALDRDTITNLLEAVLDDRIPLAEFEDWLAGSASRLPTADEIIGVVDALRRRMVPLHASVPAPIVDTCGTGGDGSGTFNISTATGATTALGILDSAIKSLDSQRSVLGAVQSRFDSVVSNLMNVSENSAAARSRIMDADFASETAALAKNQVLQQAGISVLAQANAQPQNVLALLQ